jgi:hypothetical protein
MIGRHTIQLKHEQMIFNRHLPKGYVNDQNHMKRSLDPQ